MMCDDFCYVMTYDSIRYNTGDVLPIVLQNECIKIKKTEGKK